MKKNIVYQGEPGAYSNLACLENFPSHTPLPCESFAECFARVRSGQAGLAMIPVENTVAGRVSDIYHLLPSGGLSIIGERFLPIHHQLLGVSGAKLADIKTARSHPMALGQVGVMLAKHGIKAVADVDTAGAARAVSELGDKSVAAIASKLSASTYGLDILASDVEDAAHNTTRFLVLSGTPSVPAIESGPVVSSMVFRLRSVPSALYKALGGFASNGLNMTKLESYMMGGSFSAVQFYADVEGHPESTAMKNALEELAFFSEDITHLGTYAADPARNRHD